MLEEWFDRFITALHLSGDSGRKRRPNFTGLIVSLSSWKREPAPAFHGRTRGLLAVDHPMDGEHVERIGAGRIQLADQNRAHQFVVGFPEKCAIGIKRDICLCQHLASSARLL
jgi:hypothetical protein